MAKEGRGNGAGRGGERQEGTVWKGDIHIYMGLEHTELEEKKGGSVAWSAVLPAGSSMVSATQWSQAGS